jgi:hypothetical protein
MPVYDYVCKERPTTTEISWIRFYTRSLNVSGYVVRGCTLSAMAMQRSWMD